LKVVSPPDGERPSIDWPTVSAALGSDLPRDYRELAEAYGGGQFDDYLYLLDPSGDSGYGIVSMQEERTEALAMLWADGEPKPPHLTDGSRLVVWATTDDGHCMYWLAKPGVSPDDWTVLVGEGRGPHWEHFPMGCAAFLIGTLTGKVRSELLSSVPLPKTPSALVGHGLRC
jgi:hypothetical protein